MRTYDKLIATIFGRQSTRGLRARFGVTVAKNHCTARAVRTRRQNG